MTTIVISMEAEPIRADSQTSDKLTFPYHTKATVQP